ncbi:hypothetical protein SODG_004284 [Sodalis praecaptivus]
MGGVGGQEYEQDHNWRAITALYTVIKRFDYTVVGGEIKLSCNWSKPLNKI